MDDVHVWLVAQLVELIPFVATAPKAEVRRCGRGWKRGGKGGGRYTQSYTFMIIVYLLQYPNPLISQTLKIPSAHKGLLIVPNMICQPDI